MSQFESSTGSESVWRSAGGADPPLFKTPATCKNITVKLERC